MPGFHATGLQCAENAIREEWRRNLAVLRSKLDNATEEQRSAILAEIKNGEAECNAAIRKLHRCLF